ncbi:MAG TPA: phosphatidylserine decarboxylase family protein [Cytophagaceae bacterium]|jgi:phosphatidylserine decarboxylase|nr:phosphatidylserine decarboxylase family protein [Cytophagaceae bacterium]
MTIHKEGRLLLIILVVILTIINVSICCLLPDSIGLRYTVSGFSLFLFIMILQFFRSPKRNYILNENQIIAPADGKIVVIEEVVENEYFKGKRRQISVFMSPVNVHVNRNPISGVVKYFKYHPGKYLVAWHPKSSTENERTTVVLENSKNQSILMRQIAGALARRIVWYVKEADVVSQTDEFGFIKFGSRVDVFVPLDAKIKVELNQVTKGGITVLAEFI